MSDITIFLKNPWEAIPKIRPHILRDDLAMLDKLNMTSEDLGWRTELIPVPFMGDYNKASTILLCLNPGFNEKLDFQDYSNNYYFQENMKTLTMESSYPFFCLDPKISSSGAFIWWTKILKALIDQFGSRYLSDKLMCLQYLAYHSKTYTDPLGYFPSQNYTFNLLQQAIKDQKTIIIMRSKKLWLRAVPRLATYPYMELKNYRRPFLSRGNMAIGDYEKLIESLGGQHRLDFE